MTAPLTAPVAAPTNGRAPTTGRVTGLEERALVALWLLGRVPPGLLPWPLLRPGRAGRGPGPDVREATVVLPGGVPQSGNIEVHLRASGLTRHGHRADPAYASLLAHLVWTDDRPAHERTDPWPTIEVAPAFHHDPARLRAALRQGAASTAPCASGADALGAAGSTALVRAEGRRRLAEKSWRAAGVAGQHGWADAWATLLDQALAASAGRVAEPAERRASLAAAITTALAARDPAGDPLRALAALSVEPPAVMMQALRSRGVIGAARAGELGWNAVLPLLAALAAAYGDTALARAVARLVDRWPTPRPYGRTRALAALLDRAAPAADTAPRPFRGAAYAQGLLRLQELWCERGGCGACPLSS